MGNRKMTPDEIRQKIQQVKKQRLTELDLSGNSLTEIPTEVFELKMVEKSWDFKSQPTDECTRSNRQSHQFIRT
jgi:Leucine Rich Repeat.